MKTFKGVFVGVLSSALIGCGGDSEMSSSELPSSTVKITVSNAENISKAAVSGEEAISESIAVDMLRSTEPVLSDNFSIKYLSEVVLKQFRTGGLVSLAKSTRATETSQCEDGGSVSFSGTEENGTVNFVNCLFDDMSIDGLVVISYSGSGDIDNYLEDYQENTKMTFTNVTVNSTGVSSFMNGSVQFVESYTLANNRIVGTDFIPSFSLTVGAESFKIHDFISEWEMEYTAYSWKDKGTFDDASLGVFSFDTLVDVEQSYGNYPHAGKIKVVGEGSNLVIDIVDSSTVNLELDSDGDNVADQVWSVSPSELGFEIYDY